MAALALNQTEDVETITTFAAAELLPLVPCRRLHPLLAEGREHGGARRQDHQVARQGEVQGD